MVKEQANNTLHKRGRAMVHYLGHLVETTLPWKGKYTSEVESNMQKSWSHLTPQVRKVSLEHVKIYLENFIGSIQGGPEERTHMTRHIL